MIQSDNVISKRIMDRKRLRIILFCVFSLCILAVSLIFFFFSIGRPYMGIGLSLEDGIWAIAIEDNNSLASQAGIKEGDRLLEINGQPAEVFLKQYKKAGIVLGRLIKELKVIDEHGQLKSATLNGSSVSWQYVTAQIMWLFVCLIFWIIGFYVYFKRPKSVAALLLSLCGLALGLALCANMASERLIPSAPWFEVAASVIGPWLLLHFFLVLPEERTKLRDGRLVYLIYLIAVITLVLFPIVGYADGQPTLWFRTVRMIEWGVGFIAAAGVAALNYFHVVSPRTRQQMKIMLIGCISALIPFLMLGPLPEAIWGQTIIPQGYTVIFFALIPLGMGYAVITSKLLDIDFTIKRGLVYGLITVVMAIFLSTAIFSVLVFREQIGIPGEIAIALVLGGLATALFGPTKKGAENLVNRLFYKDGYDYRQIIQSLSFSLNSVKGLPDISRLVLGTTVNTLALKGGCLFIKTQSELLETTATQGIFTDITKQESIRALISRGNSLNEFPNSATTLSPEVAFLVRLLAGEKEIGYLCLSHKVSGQRFSPDDFFLIQGISSVSSIALHSAILVRDISLRDIFVSIASHELRTPLTAISGYTELMLQENPPHATWTNWLKIILDNGQKITNMTNDLLNITRIQSGKIMLKLDPLKVSDILIEQTDVIRRNSDKHEFLFDIAPDLPDVLIDRDKFSQVVGNLLDNAIKYSPNGGRITISAHTNTSQNSVVVGITDEGLGISPEDKNSLFTTFHRIQRPETQGIRGSGLGLYIAKEWTVAMGGKIWVESELNKGSTFFLEIPTHYQKTS